jgi:hypothetical protein
MLTTHTITLHHIITVYNNIDDHTDCVIRVLPYKKTPWNEDLFFAAKLSQRKLSKNYAEVTPTTHLGMIYTDILDPFRKLRLFRKWGMGTDTNPGDETSHITQLEDALLKYVENEYHAKHRCVLIDKHESLLSSNFVCSSLASRSFQSFWDAHDLSSDDEEYLRPNNVAEMTPGQEDRAARLLTAARLSLNSLPEAPAIWGQINPNRNNYPFDPMAISSAFLILDMPNWWLQQEEPH